MDMQTWLKQILPTTISISKSTSPRAIVAAVERQHDVIISYNTAKRAKKNHLEEDLQHQSHQFQLLPAYGVAVLSADPRAHVRLWVGDREGAKRFKQFFVCPGVSREAYRQCRSVLAIDCTPANDAFDLVILTATSVDAENHVVLIAWALADQESADAWRLFLSNLRSAVPEANDPSTTVVVEDCEKGLVPAQDEVPLSVRALCLDALSRNLQKGCGLVARKIFDSAIRTASTHQELLMGMGELQGVSPAAVAYLQGIDQSLWAEPYFLGRRYGHGTSQVAEIMDGLIGEEKKLSAVDLLQALWSKNRGLRSRHLQEATALYPTVGLTEYAGGLLRQSCRLSSHQFSHPVDLHRAVVRADSGEW